MVASQVWPKSASEDPDEAILPTAISKIDVMCNARHIVLAQFEFFGPTTKCSLKSHEHALKTRHR